MGKDFRNFNRLELGILKEKEENSRKYTHLMWFLIIIISIILFFGGEFSPQLDRLIKTHSNWFLLAWLIITMILLNIFGRKISFFSLTPKEKVLLKLCEAQKSLEKFFNSKDKNDLDSSISFFADLSEELEKSNLDSKGFNTEIPMKKFFEEFSIFLDNYIPEKLCLSLSEDEYYKLENILTNIFIEIQDENFDKVLTMLQKHNEKYQEKGKLLKTLVGQIKQSPLLKIIFYLFLIIVIDLISWGIFNLIKINYPHFFVLPIIAVIVFGLKNEIDSLILKIS